MKLSENAKNWTFVFIWVSLIYSTLYIVRPVCEYFKTFDNFSIMTDVTMVIVLLGLVVWASRKIKFKHLSTYILLVIVLGIYAYGIYDIQFPEEKVHFIEYGVLGFLTYKAFSLKYLSPTNYILAYLLTSLFGLGDEGIQHILPNRHYQTEDVLLNSFSGALGLLMTFIFVREANLQKQKAN